MYVDVKDVQRYELEILKEFDRICDKMGVIYSISGGTLLGAVRHKGFIPWDDDVDVMMTRENYESFLARCDEYLPDGWYMQTFHHDKNYPISFGKLRNGNIKLTVKEVLELDMGVGACIDIFPIDKCANNKIVNLYDRIRLSIIMFIKYSILDEGNEPFGVRKYIRKLTKKIVMKKGTIYKMNLIEEKIRKQRNKKKNKYTYADFIMPAYKLKYNLRIEWKVFESIKKIKFEDCEFMSIINHDRYLKYTYGDYMKLPPKDERVPEHNFILLK